jgi:hypothetical protein
MVDPRGLAPRMDRKSRHAPGGFFRFVVGRPRLGAALLEARATSTLYGFLSSFCDRHGWRSGKPFVSRGFARAGYDDLECIGAN